MRTRSPLTDDVHVRLPKKVAEALRRAADAAGIPFSTYCRVKLAELARKMPEPRAQ